MKLNHRLHRLFALGTILALLVAMVPIGVLAPGGALAATGDPVLLNEVYASHSGTDDTEFIELYGTPGANLDGLSVLVVESDAFGPGTIDKRFDFGASDTLGTNGFYLIGNPTGLGTNYGVAPNLSIPNNTLENSSMTIALVETSSISGSTVTGAEVVNDAVALNDGDTGDTFYFGAPVIGPDGPFFPAGARRVSDGVDTDTAADWVISDFGLGSANTPTAGAFPEPPPSEVCSDPFVPIYDIQSSGDASPIEGSEVATEGVVVGDFQSGGPGENGNLGGFFLQDPAGDSDPSTSDGIFVFVSSPDVALGDRVRVRGDVDEFFNLTEITNVSLLLGCSTGNTVAPTALSLPVGDVSDLEAYEGMLVTFPQTLYISEFFNFDRFGEIVLTTDRQFQPTAVEEPGSAGAAAVASLNARSRITLDDGRGNQNPDPALHPNGGVFDLTNRFRGGDTVANVTGVMDYAFGRYRIQPTQGADYTAANPRPGDNPDVGGDIQVAAFNVLNYFTTLDQGGNLCGPPGFEQGCRGADNANELARQRAKIVAALAELDADVVGLIEIQNDGDDASVADLVAGVNAILGAGTYEYIATGFIGTDPIKQAFIYKPAAVSPIGGFAVLDTDEFVDPNGLGDPKNRPALAQTFMDNGTGGLVTVVVNHFKSKGSACGPGDDDPEAGSCNLTRTLAAQELVDWLSGNPTGFGTGSTLIIGDLNSYDKEDPIDVLTSAGYDDLLFDLQGELAYSYVFDGQLGYLDYVMSSSDLGSAITGAAAWHINTDEPDILDYDTTFKRAPQDALYEPNEFRSSDHDPVLAGVKSDLIEAVTFETLQALVEYYEGTGEITGNNTATALLDHLGKAARFRDSGQAAAANAQLQAFINQVQGKAPQFVTQQAADILSAAASTLIDG